MKVILITGGSGGIGASTAIQCAARGMGVILTCHHHADAAGGHPI
ncbi:SDR family NAD(P)-dependent oxidoreductase [Sodalis sp. RH24]